ncbi:MULTISPECIES: hypothetical protein [unclassified Clostridium]|nr:MULTISPECIES: hypothetical protein [unclassified Clostridium]
MNTSLDMLSAVWDGKQWIDENSLKYTSDGSKSIKKCLIAKIVFYI